MKKAVIEGSGFADNFNRGNWARFGHNFMVGFSCAPLFMSGWFVPQPQTPDGIEEDWKAVGRYLAAATKNFSE